MTISWASPRFRIAFDRSFGVYNLSRKTQLSNSAQKRKNCRTSSAITLSVFFRLTCFQFFVLPSGSFDHLFTSKTHALQISPLRSSLTWKHPLNWDSYLVEAVNRELEDFAPQMQQPKRERKTFGLCDGNILTNKCGSATTCQKNKSNFWLGLFIATMHTKNRAGTELNVPHCCTHEAIWACAQHQRGRNLWPRFRPSDSSCQRHSS